MDPIDTQKEKLKKDPQIEEGMKNISKDGKIHPLKDKEADANESQSLMSRQGPTDMASHEVD